MRPVTTSSRRWLAVLVTAVATALTTTACTTTGGAPAGATDPGATSVAGAPETSLAPSAGATPGGAADDDTTEVRGAVTALLTQRAAAVVAHDKNAWLASVADAGSVFGVAQTSLYDRLVALPVAGLTARAVSLTPSSSGDAYVANAQLAYRFTGYDQGDRSFAVSYLVGRSPGGWRLTGPGPGRTDPQPFDLDGATSVSSPGTLVIGDVPPETLEAYLALGAAARQPIEASWGQVRPAVIVAPKTTAELEAQLGRGSFAGLDQVAAITDGPLTAGEPAPSDRVFLNPDAVGRLSAEGRRVVITHELTHVTIRGSTTRPVPIWLSEGYADEVAYSGSGLPPRTVAADLLTLVRNGKGPTALPTTSDFDPSRGPIDPTYNAAWLAVLLIHDQYGPDPLTRFYRAVSGGPTADTGGTGGTGGTAVTGSADERTRQAFPAVLGVSQDAFVADWKAYLARLAA